MAEPKCRQPAPTWRIIGSFGGDVDVAPSNGNNVVIAVGTQVFVSTNALAPTVGAPSGVTFTNITRNMPVRSVTRARFDPIDPTVIYAVLGGFSSAAAGQPSGHVFRTTIGASAWTDISPVVKSPIVGSADEKLDVPFNALALDGTDIPTTIYVGTDFGVLRSMDVGQSWSVLDDILVAAGVFGAGGCILSTGCCAGCLYTGPDSLPADELGEQDERHHHYYQRRPGESGQGGRLRYRASAAACALDRGRGQLRPVLRRFVPR